MARRQIVDDEQAKKPSAMERTGNLFEQPSAPTRRRMTDREADEGYKVTHTTEPGQKQYPQRIPAGCIAAEGDQPACHACGARLTIDGKGKLWSPCGHGLPHEPPMQKGWVKDETHPRWSQEAIAKEPGHGASPLTIRGEVLYCSVCRLAQFDLGDPQNPGTGTCAQGHAGAPGLTASELRAKDASLMHAADSRPDEPRPGGGSRFTTTELRSEVHDKIVDSTAEGKTVTVVWGKELYSPRQFHTYEVGPFTATVAVFAGESIADAAHRAMEDLRKFAVQERVRKRDEYEKFAGSK